MTQEELDEILKEHQKWLDGEGGERAFLKEANLAGANLKSANLAGAYLERANLDYSCLPLWCGSLHANFDDKQIIQIIYHAVCAGLQSNNTSDETKRELSKLVDFANKFHRVEKCGYLKPFEKEKK